ncbi:MAG: enoyl-CoA hydratase-related protein [Acidimicrobiia bacterium]
MTSDVQADGIGVLRLNNPPMNALSTDLLNALCDRATELTADTNVRAVVILGGERAFAAGADIANFGGAQEGAIVARAFRAAFDAIAALPQPVIAGVRRFALGGGCELALAADLRVAAEDAVFGQPEILLGIIPGAGGTQRLARLVGVGRAKELIYTGRTVKAEEALAIGLVNRVVANDVLETETLAWAAQLAAGATDAIRRAKRCIEGGWDASLSDGLDLEEGEFIDVFTTEDAAIGLESFRTNGPGKATFVGR